MVNQNVLCCIEVKLHHLNPLKNDFQTKLGISSVLLPEEGFHHWRSLWAVVALYQPLKRKEKKNTAGKLPRMQDLRWDRN